jgi:hypothetical protein
MDEAREDDEGRVNPAWDLDDWVANITQASAEQAVDEVPRSLRKALAGHDGEEWRKALDVELNKFKKFDVFEEVDERDMKPGARPLYVHPVLSYRAGVRRVRITACDNKPRLHGETFAPTVRTKSVRWLLGDVAASMVGGRRRKRLHQVDIEAAYLNAEVKGTIYVRPLPEFGVGPGKVWMLKKALYGTKEAANLWNGDLHNTLLDLGMVQSAADKCLYHLERPEGTIVAAVHVDDLLFSENNKAMWKEFKDALCRAYDVEEGAEGNMFYCGVDFEVDEAGGRILLSQKAYIQQLLRRYKAEGYDPVDTPWGSNVSLASWGLAGPKAGSKGQWSKGARVVTEHEAAEYRSAVSALLWLYKMTRPDLGYALSQLTKYASKPSSAAVDCLKRVLAYVKATEDLPLVLRGRVGELKNEEELYIRAWSDSDWAGDKETRRSLGGYCVELQGTATGTISWSAKQQDCVTLSSVEAEYVQLSEAAKEIVWFRRLMKDFRRRGNDQRKRDQADLTLWRQDEGEEAAELQGQGRTQLLGDNNGARFLAAREAYHERTKHVDVRYHFTREKVLDGTLEVLHKKTEEMVADIFTKPLGAVKFKLFRDYLLDPTKENEQKILKLSSQA